MYPTWRCCLYLVLLVVVVAGFFKKQYNARQDTERCFCQLTGTIDDCCCSVQDVDKLNTIYVNSRIKDITKRDYFRYVKLNLDRPCPFWPDLGQCAMKDCSVDKCSADELPEMLRRQYQGEFENKYTREANAENHDHGVEGDPCSRDEDRFGDLNVTITEAKLKKLRKWSTYDGDEGFCVHLGEHSDEAEWVDLVSNREQYTGYQGYSAHLIWSSIYRENCFLPAKAIRSYDEFHKMFLSKTCLEKRVFYRIVSGLHASISIHLTYHYPLSKDLPTKTTHFGPNPQLFRERFHPDRTGGQGPYWLKNLHFTYLVVLRAVTKAAPYWRDFNFFTGNTKQDVELKQVILDLVKSTKTCPSTFDESLMFTGDSHILKEEIRIKFKNITQIMDCVGCERCKIWGKLQTTGIATALKILFSSDDDWSLVPMVNGKRFSLTRSEIVALFQSLSKLSNSLIYLSEFRGTTPKEDL